MRQKAIGARVVAQKLPDIVDRFGLRAFRQQGDEGDFVWHDEARGKAVTL